MSLPAISIVCNNFKILSSIFPLGDTDIPDNLKPPQRGASSSSDWEIFHNGISHMKCSASAWTEGLKTSCKITGRFTQNTRVLTADQNDPKYIALTDDMKTQLGKVQSFVETWMTQNQQ